MVVSNTTVILYLLKIRRADLLQNYTKTIFIPREVQEELLAGEERYRQEIILLQGLIFSQFIQVVTVPAITNYGLDRGENSVLSLCAQKKDTIFLSDDAGARKTARSMGYTTVGTLGILLHSLKSGKINSPEFFKLLEELIGKGYYISTELYAELVKRVNQMKKG